MRFTGQVYGRGYAQQEGCLPIPYELIAPTRTPENLMQLRLEITRWQRTVEEYRLLVAQGKITVDVERRAQFGVDVLRNVLLNVDLNICCVLLAADADGTILGVMIYMILPPDTGLINLLVVDPLHLHGSPVKPQLRGVGTSLVAAASQRMLAAGVTQVNLHPLDGEAERFWRGRGFATCGFGNLLCIRGRSAIERLIGQCLATPEQAHKGEIVICGLPLKVRQRLLASFPQPQPV